MEKEMEKLVLIDSNAIIHRAYHALPKSMSTRAGEQTNVVYGFATTLIKVLEDLKPKYIATSFDLEGPTFRHVEYEDYKATRVKADQELYDQIPRVKEMIEIMKIPIYELQGFEADDVIGTIVRKVQDTRNKVQTYIVSGDKDIFQLINGNVKVYNLRRGLSDTQIVDRESIEKEYNLQPEDFIDLKALAGDPSDNIPGVPGIGPKTATQLLQDFDTLEKLYEAIEDRPPQTSPLRQGSEGQANLKPQTYNLKAEKLIKPRIKELLIKHKDQAFLSQRLATIRKDVPVDFDIEKAEWGGYDKDKLRQFFEQLNFKSLLRRFGIVEEESKLSRQPTEGQRRKDGQLKLL